MAVIRPFVIGFATTLRHLFKKPITVNYPDQKFPMFPKFRGKQVLMRDENGLEKCVACGLCPVACPADAIYLEAAENDGTVQAGDSAVAIRGKQLWVSIDSPENLRIEVRGKQVHVPGLKPQVIIVTATGWHPAHA